MILAHQNNGNAREHWRKTADLRFSLCRAVNDVPLDSNYRESVTLLTDDCSFELHFCLQNGERVSQISDPPSHSITSGSDAA